MSDKEQVKPLAPAAHRINIDDDHDRAFSIEHKNHPNRKYIKCCGCIAALILIQAVIILILIFTVFQIKDPDLTMNSINIQGLDRVSLATLRSGTNITALANVSIKNPNVAAFKFGNSTTTIYYRGVVVGEAQNPPGVAKARRTIRMNVTMNVMVDKLLGVSSFGSDYSSRMLPMGSYTSIGGKVKILKIIKKHVVVRMNCTMTVNISSQTIQDQSCDRKVLL